MKQQLENGVRGYHVGVVFLVVEKRKMKKNTICSLNISKAAYYHAPRFGKLLNHSSDGKCV